MRRAVAVNRLDTQRAGARARTHTHIHAHAHTWLGHWGEHMKDNGAGRKKTHVVFGRTAPLLDIHHFDVQHSPKLHLDPAEVMHRGVRRPAAAAPDGAPFPRGSGVRNRDVHRAAVRSPGAKSAATFAPVDSTTNRSISELIDKSSVQTQTDFRRPHGSVSGWSPSPYKHTHKKKSDGGGGWGGFLYVICGG